MGVLLLLPWFSPFSAGPLPHAWHLLLSAVCALIFWFFRRQTEAAAILGIWILAASFSAFFGLIQYFGLAAFLDPLVSPAQAGEAFANLRQRNQFATLTSIGLVALMGRLAAGSGPARAPTAASSRTVPWWAYPTALLLALGNAASSSRTGLLQWIVIALLAACWFRKEGDRLTMFALQALLTFGLALFALPWLLELTTGARSSGLFGRMVEDLGCSSRTVLWSNVVTLIAEKPWLGWGWGELDYAHFMTIYPGPRFCAILDNAHNLPLHLAVELGLPVALIIFAGLGWLVWRVKPWRDIDPMRQTAWGVLLMIGLHSLLEYPLWYGPFQLTALLCIVMLWRPPQVGKRSIKDQKMANPHASKGLIATVFITILLYIAWDYHRISQIYLMQEHRNLNYRTNTLTKIQGSWLFASQVMFAELTLTPLNRHNAQWTLEAAQALLHFSPEPRVIEKVIESAVMLGRDDVAMVHLARYKAAFPLEHGHWAMKNSAKVQMPAPLALTPSHSGLH